MILLAPSGISFAQNPTVKVGFIVPESGPAAQEMQSLIAGFDFYLKSNAPKLKFEIVKKNIARNETNVLETVAELLAKDVRFLVGPPTDRAAELVAQGVSGHDVILFSTGASVKLGAGELCSNSTFQLSPNTWQTGYPLSAWCIEKLGTKAFITGDAAPTSNEQADFFAHGFEHSGGSFIDRAMADPGKVPDVLKSIAKSDAEIVFAAFQGDSAAVFLKELGVLAPKVKHVLGPESLVRVKTINQKIAPSINFITDFKDSTQFSANIKKKIKKEIPDISRAAEGHDIASVIAQVAHEKDNKQAIQLIENMVVKSPRGEIRFDKNHEPLLEMTVCELVKTGKAATKAVADLGVVKTPDFGCGKVGFPKKTEPETKEEEPFWDDRE